MTTSKHAEIRKQQRGIRPEEIELLLKFGRPEHKIGGALEYKMSQKDVTRATQDLKRQLQLIDKARKKAVVVSSDNVVITVYALT
jgi:hypothetical protein